MGHALAPIITPCTPQLRVVKGSLVKWGAVGFQMGAARCLTPLAYQRVQPRSGHLIRGLARRQRVALRHAGREGETSGRRTVGPPNGSDVKLQAAHTRERTSGA